MGPAAEGRFIRVLILLPSFNRSGPVNGAFTLCKHLGAAGVVPDVLAMAETCDEPIQTRFQDLGLSASVAAPRKWNLRTCFQAVQSQLISGRYQALHTIGLRPDIFASFLQRRSHGVRFLSSVQSTIADDLVF